MKFAQHVIDRHNTLGQVQSDRASLLGRSQPFKHKTKNKLCTHLMYESVNVCCAKRTDNAVFPTLESPSTSILNTIYIYIYSILH